MDKLSERQKQCLALVARGHTSKEIGRILDLSPSTIDNHLSIVLERLGVNSRMAAARLLINGNNDIELSRITTDEVDAQRIHVTHQNEYMGGPADSRSPLIHSLFSIPPLGGRGNNLSHRRRYYHLVQIMLIALMGFSAVTVTIAGIVHLFSQ